MSRLQNLMSQYSDEVQRSLLEMFPKSYINSPLFEEFLQQPDMVEVFFKKERKDHLLAAPLFEVLSARIFSTSRQPLVIHGTIEITDGEGAHFTLFHRNSDMPQSVPYGGSLTLLMQVDRAIIPSNVMSLRVDLKANTANGVVDFVNVSRTWDLGTLSVFDQLHESNFSGVLGSFLLQHIIHQHAVFATVAVKLLDGKSDQDHNGAPIYGTIIASYAFDHSLVLFQKEKNDPLIVDYNSYIELSTRVVVVPARSSSFTIHATLFNADNDVQIADLKDDEYFTFDHGYGQTIGDGIKVEVTWNHPLMLQIPNQIQVPPDPQSLPIFLSNRDLPFSVRKSSSLEVLEMFSIAFYSNIGEEVSVWGSVTVHGEPFAREGYQFFNVKRQPDGPHQKFLPNQPLPITYPDECIVSPSFKISLDLEDDGLISMGDACWGDGCFETPFSWFNKPLSSVVRGEKCDCYGVVNYSIFPLAVKAVVWIHLIDKNNYPGNTFVDGCIRSQYSDFSYVTPYDQEFYRRRLFVGRKEDPPLKFENSRILLSRSVVAVPELSSLIVALNLRVIRDDNMLNIVTFEEQREFKSNMGNQVKNINKTSHSMEISVEWSEVN